MSFLTVCLNPTLQKILRFSSITPGDVNRTGDHRLDVSGKGINVTRVLTQLGKKVLHLTQLGGVMRPMFLSLCEQDGLSVEWAESNSEIRFCYTMLTDSDGGVTELIEESQAVGAGTEERLLEKYNSLIGAQNFSYLIISGTKAEGFSDTLIPAMVRKAKEKGLKVILDVKGKDLLKSLPFAPDIIKPNLLEFAATFAPELIKDNKLIADNEKAQERINNLAAEQRGMLFSRGIGLGFNTFRTAPEGRGIKPSPRIKSIALDIAKKYNCRIILTNGSRKILAVEGNNSFEVDIQSVKAVNTTGCGDSFTAGLSAALDDGADFRSAINEGIRCGALNAGFVKPGVIR
ncbi:MAG: PfkB family carbohydrate kinase [Treponema sp.]|jgi:fructose-1-phosphate kinase PfkB-like protein|nr:PfkB family carbohydrate kinase [Treponema sp.]